MSEHLRHRRRLQGRRRRCRWACRVGRPPSPSPARGPRRPSPSLDRVTSSGTSGSWAGATSATRTPAPPRPARSARRGGLRRNAARVDALAARHGAAAVHRPRGLPRAPAARHRRHRQPVGRARRRTSTAAARARPARARREAARRHDRAHRRDARRRSAGAGVTLGVFFQDRSTPDLAGAQGRDGRGRRARPRRRLADARVKWYRPPEYYASRTGAGRGRSTAAAR